MKKILLPGLGFVIVLATVLIYFIHAGKATEEKGLIRVKKGNFVSAITTTGELEAKNSVMIQGPSQLYIFEIYQLVISNMVPEGTVVKKGDWIADLDRSEFNTKVQNTESDLEKAQTKFLETKLDTALEMRKARDDLINLKYSADEAKIKVDESQYEPPATIKKNEYDYQKALRSYEQSHENYKIKYKQNNAKMQEVDADLRKYEIQYRKMENLAGLFTITAPKAGMVIYTKDWDNQEVKTGSRIWAWDPVVATLPDMSSMISKTYINEVDVQKIKPGQKVEIGLDAFPDKQLSGTVASVANVGEQRQNSNTKVFEAVIQVDGTDYSIRPSMTTSNRIIIKSLRDVIAVPLACLYSENDTVTYVYKKNGFKVIKQEVETGSSNNDISVILKGLNEGDYIYASPPQDYKDEPVVYLPGMDGHRNPVIYENDVLTGESAMRSLGRNR